MGCDKSRSANRIFSPIPSPTKILRGNTIRSCAPAAPWRGRLYLIGRACFLATAIGFSGEAADGDMHCGLACGARAKSQNGNRRRNQGSKIRGQDGEGIKVAAIDAMHSRNSRPGHPTLSRTATTRQYAFTFCNLPPTRGYQVWPSFPRCHPRR